MAAVVLVDPGNDEIVLWRVLPNEALSVGSLPMLECLTGAATLASGVGNSTGDAQLCVPGSTRAIACACACAC